MSEESRNEPETEIDEANPREESDGAAGAIVLGAGAGTVGAVVGSAAGPGGAVIGAVVGGAIGAAFGAAAVTEVEEPRVDEPLGLGVQEAVIATTPTPTERESCESADAPDRKRTESP